MEVTKQVVIIGVGNCGNQVAWLAEQKYPTLFDTIYINTSDNDLSMVKSENSLKFKIGDQEEVKGSGKNRTKMKEYLEGDIKKILSSDELTNCIIGKKYAFIVVSAAGGTGSGAGPVLLDVMRQCYPDINFILVGVLPKIKSSLMELGNTLEFLDELYNILGDSTTYMMYDNETTSELPPTVSLSTVNECIVEDIRVLTGVDNFATPYESIDEADMESIITTPGRLIVTRVTKKLTEKVMEDSSLDDMIIKSIKQSCHAETDRNKRVIRWGIITFFTEAVNKMYSPELEKVQEFIGTPVERFNHNAINSTNENANFLYMIASGLSPINDRVEKITDRIEELKKSLANDESSKYILEDGGTSYDVLAERKKLEKRQKQQPTIKTSEIFSKFMK